MQTNGFKRNYDMAREEQYGWNINDIDNNVDDNDDNKNLLKYNYSYMIYLIKPQSLFHCVIIIWLHYNQSIHLE